MGLRFNPPPNWPPPPPGFVPPPRWQPDPSWPPPPPGWQLWVPDDVDPETGAWPGDFATGDFSPGEGDFAAGPGDFATQAGGFPGGPGDLGTGPADFATGALPGQDPSGRPGQPYPPRGRRGRPGAGLARNRRLRIALLALAGVAVLALILILVLGGSPKPAQSPSAGGRPSPSSSSSPSASASSSSSSSSSSGSAQATNVFSLHDGQCFQNPPDSQTLLGITYLSVVPCTTAHNAQVFVQFAAKGTKYPGSAPLKRQADQGCHARIAKNLQKSKITDTMTLRYLYPLPASWAGGHRAITCLIVDAKPDLKSSLLRAHPAG